MPLRFFEFAPKLLPSMYCLRQNYALYCRILEIKIMANLSNEQATILLYIILYKLTIALHTSAINIIEKHKNITKYH